MDFHGFAPDLRAFTEIARGKDHFIYPITGKLINPYASSPQHAEIYACSHQLESLQKHQQVCRIRESAVTPASSLNSGVVAYFDEIGSQM